MNQEYACIILFITFLFSFSISHAVHDCMRDRVIKYTFEKTGEKEEACDVNRILRSKKLIKLKYGASLNLRLFPIAGLKLILAFLDDTRKQ